MLPTGQGGSASHQRGNAFPTPAGRLYGFIQTGAFYQLKGAVPRQRSGTIYLPRAKPSTRPGGVSRSRTEPLAPRAKGPAAPSTLARESGRQPSGIQLPADSSHKPMVSLTPKALEPPLHFFPYLWYIESDIFNSLQGREKVHGWNWQSEPGWWKRVREFHGSASLS